MSTLSQVQQVQPFAPESLFRVLFPALTLALVLASASGVSPGTPILLILLVTGVVLLGLPHGALDPLVARQLWASDSRFTMTRFLILYSVIAALCAAGWVLGPKIALVAFLVISAYHFGSDWQGRSSAWGQTAFGLSVVSVPTLRKAAAVEEIYRQLGASNAHQIVSASQVVAVVAITVALIAATVYSRSRLSNLIELSTVVVGGLVLPPLLFFTCYFCLQHSPRHLLQTAAALGLKGMRKTVSAATPTVLATLVLALGLWIALPASVYTQKILQFVFIGLAALTAPHMLLTEFALRRDRLLART